MAGDSFYQDLQFKDNNVYSVLEESTAKKQNGSKDGQTVKDVDVLERNLRDWKRATITVTLLIVIMFITGGVLLLTQCGSQKADNRGLQKLREKICATDEIPCQFCGNKWTYYSGNCYYFSPDSMNWTESRDSCERMEAPLAVIKTKKEETFVEQTARQLTWIGLSKNKAGTWIWEDGTALTDKGYWKPNEPNNQGGIEDCVEVFPSNYYPTIGWNDFLCNEKRKRLCKNRLSHSLHEARLGADILFFGGKANQLI